MDDLRELCARLGVTPEELAEALRGSEVGMRLVARARRRDDARATLARHDSAAFASYVLRDEETRARIKMAPYHTEWHELVRDNSRLVIWAHFGAGKTQQLSIAETLFALGNDSGQRVVIVSATGGTEGTSTKIAGSIARYIEKSPELRRVFPDLKPGNVWSPAKGALVVQREHWSKDFSVQSVGVHGAILGARIDLLILDDILTMENTRTEGRRADVLRWIKTTLLTRVTPRGKVIFIGNAWHHEDAMYEMSKVWPHKAYPVRTPDGVLAWPERWPATRVAAFEREVGPLEAARLLYCQPRSDEDARFKEAWIQAALERGAGRALRRDVVPASPLPEVPGCKRWTGVDFGASKKAGGGLTSLVTVESERRPDGNNDSVILDVEAGRWAIDEVLRRMLDAHARFGSTLVVEAVGMQIWAADLVRLFGGDKVPVIPFQTGKNKHHPRYGVEGLAADMALGLWALPCAQTTEGFDPHPQVAALCQEMRYYDPQAHTGDRLMAMWFAREAAAGRVHVHRVSEVGPISQAELDKAIRDSVVSRRGPNAATRVAAERRKTQKAGLWSELDQMLNVDDW